jgi:hypothetical protein
MWTREKVMTLIPTRVTFRGLPHSDALDVVIRERIVWLEQFYTGIVGCRVLVEVPHRHHHNGRHFHVRIEVTVPGARPVVVSHEPSLHGPLKNIEEAVHRKETELESVHRYARVAVHHAFDAARRQLQDFAREQRGAVKSHEVPAHDTVAEISKVDGYGFVQAAERQIYFSRPSVLDDAFDELVVGTPVAFVEERGEKGRKRAPCACSVSTTTSHPDRQVPFAPFDESPHIAGTIPRTGVPSKDTATDLPAK